MENKTYAYCRQSQAGQSESSIIRQRETINAYAFSHNLTVANYFIDEGVSGFSGKQQELGSQFNELINSLRKGDTILIEVMSRFSRQDSDRAGHIFTGLLLDGITIITCADGTIHKSDENSTIATRLNRMLEQETAYKESKDKSLYAKKGHERRLQKIAKGEFVKMPTVGWLEFDSSKFKYQLNSNAKIVEQIFAWCIDGFGATVISQRLNEAEIKTFQRDKAWSQSGVHHILNNEIAFGRYKGIDNYFEAVVTEREFNQAREAIALRKTMKTTRVTKSVNLWAGIGICDSCGERLHVVRVNKRNDRWLICYGKIKGNGCDAKNLKNSTSEIAFKEILLKLGSNNLLSGDSTKLAQDVNVISGQIIEQEKRLQGITTAMVDSGTSKALTDASKIVDDKLKILRSKKLEAEGRLINEQSIEDSREWFNANLDIVKPEGRRAANQHLLRLDVKVRIFKVNNDSIVYTVSRKGKEIWSLIQVKIDQLIAIPVHKRDLNIVEKYDSKLTQKRVKALHESLPKVRENTRNEYLSKLDWFERHVYFCSLEGEERISTMNSFILWEDKNKAENTKE